MAKSKEGVKILAQNKKAYHDYFINDIYQAGIELLGTEVKSLRAGRCNLKDSFVRIEGGEAFLYGMHISPYEHGNIFNKDPVRKRRLLLHKFEIKRLWEAAAQEGLTIVPTRIYLTGSLVKIDIAVAKGKKLYDKRDSIAERDVKREAQKEFKLRNLG
jgi:SsrA-binding protein